MAIGPCPHLCENKNTLGYCLNTACINPNYNQSYIYISPYNCYHPMSNACQKCLNNPINGGSGICHCILGTPTIY